MTPLEANQAKLKLELFRIDFRDEQRLLQELCDMLECSSLDLVKEVKKLTDALHDDEEEYAKTISGLRQENTDLKEQVKAWETDGENTDQQVADLAEKVRLFESIMAFKED